MAVISSGVAPGHAPFLSAPQGTDLPFWWVGVICAAVGLIVGTVMVRFRGTSMRWLLGSTAVAAILGVLPLIGYNWLYAIDTPSDGTYLAELALFAVGYFGLYALLAIGWHVIDRELLSKLPWP